MKLPLTPLLAAPLLSVAALSAQSLSMPVSGGGIGQALRYEIRGGQPNQRFIFASALTRGRTPLSILDGKDTRTFGLGLGLTGVWLYGQFDAAGRRAFSGVLPNDPNLVGLALLHQALAYPGTNGFAIDGLSEVVVVPMDNAGAFKTQTSVMSTARQFATNIPLPDGRILIVGGATNVILWQNAVKTTEIFDPATRTFTPGPDLVQARSSHTQTRLNDGRYLLVGGVDEKNIATATCEVFDPKTMTFAAVGALTYKRTFHGAVKMPNGKVVVLSGFADMGALLGTQRALESGIRETEIFDPATDRWTVGASLAAGRGAPGVQDIGNGKVLVIGGVVKSGFAPDLSNTCELYDMTTNRVSAAAPIATRTAFMTTFQLPGNRVLVAGGDAGPRGSIQSYSNIATRTCMIYTAATNTWGPVAPLPVATSGGDAITLRDGTLVLAGGGDNTLYWPHGNRDILTFDPSNNTWSVLASLVTGRNSGETVELQAGGIAVFGGGINNAARSTDSWELLVR